MYAAVPLCVFSILVIAEHIYFIVKFKRAQTQRATPRAFPLPLLARSSHFVPKAAAGATNYPDHSPSVDKRRTRD